MLCQPSLNQFTVVNLQIVKDEIDFATRILDQPMHESYQALAVHVLFVEHEPDLALVGDGRDHVDSVLLGCLA